MKSVIVLLLAGMLSYAFCQDTTQETTEKATKTEAPSSAIKLSGFGYYMFGQIVSGTYGDDFTPGSRFSHLWVNTSLMHLNLTSDATDWFTAKLGLEMYADFPLKGSSAMDKSSYFRSYKAYLASAEGIMHWKFDNNILNSLIVESGLFPYTINSQVKTLGNYLYRSTIHPLSVQNKVDYPWADLLGVNAEAGFFENKLKLNATLSSEFIYVPFFDFTPAFGISYAPNKIIDIGGAIAFHHAIQADCALLPDSIGKKWQGTKMDARAIFDPKPLLGLDELSGMGKDECKIYAEIAVIGLKDSVEVDTAGATARDTIVFPENSLAHHIPFMIGFNVPTFKILNSLSIELEWFNSPYANDWFGLYTFQSSSARQPTSKEQWETYFSGDNFKWSIFANKTIGKFELRAIFGSDHTVYRLLNQSTGNFEQTMKKKGDWQWMLEMRYNL